MFWTHFFSILTVVIAAILATTAVVATVEAWDEESFLRLLLAISLAVLASASFAAHLTIAG